MFIEPIGCIRALRSDFLSVLLGVVYDFFNEFSGDPLPPQRIVDKGMIEADRRAVFRRKGNFGNNFSGIIFRINSIFLMYKLHTLLLIAAERSMP